MHRKRNANDTDKAAAKRTINSYHVSCGGTPSTRTKFEFASFEKKKSLKINNKGMKKSLQTIKNQTKQNKNN